MERLLFVGIGGTGGKVGMQLEDNLRHLLCGPNGDRLLDNEAFRGLVAYQLPDYVRSVYLDLDGELLNELGRSALATRSQAVAGSRRVLHNLVASPTSYPAVAAGLRAGATGVVSGWLPPRLSEPRVSPLSVGAGQFPTVGRAALYEILRSKGAESTFFEPFRQAVGELDAADMQLRAQHGASAHVSNKCNVYVAFSLAGGTGCGLFLDVLHLIEECFAERTRLEPVIHPLVAMPSSFDAQRGGGRAAQLNAASAVIDLGRYVDDQNTGRQSEVVLPDGRSKVIRASTRGRGLAPTAYLFSRPQTHSQDDHIRVMAAFAGAKVASTIDKQDRADFNHLEIGVNRSAQRAEPAAQGIGQHPFTVAYAGALSVPNAEISRVLASTILAAAESTLRNQNPVDTTTISDEEVLDVMRVSSGLIKALERELPEPLGRIRSERGASGLRRALARQRRRAIRDIERFEAGVHEQLRAVVNIDWREAISAAVELGADPYQLARVVGLDNSGPGQPSLRQDLLEVGFDSYGVVEGAPEVPVVQDRLGPFKFLARWLGVGPNSAVAVGYNHELNTWQKNRATQLWQEAWQGQQAVAEAAYREMADAVTAIVGVLQRQTRHADFDADETFSRLFERRQGVVNYIPGVANAGRLSQFSDEVLTKIYLTMQLQPDGIGAIRFLHELGGWKEIGQAASSGRRADMADAVDRATATLADRVERILRTTEFYEEAVLPSLSEMLQQAADGSGPVLSDFSSRIAEFLASVLSSATDIGLAPSHIVVSYPTTRARDSDSVESFLRRFLDQAAPASSALTIQRSDSADLVVTAIRTEVALLDVPEARRCIRLWDEALRTPSVDSRLWWRQRMGWETHSYLTSPSDHVRIMFALLNGLWSGIVLPGPPEGNSMSLIIRSPDSLAPENQELLSDIELRLYLVSPPIDGLSGWSGFITAYEHLVVNASMRELEMLRQWMDHLPVGVTQADRLEIGSAQPAYLHFVRQVEQDLMLLERELNSGISHPAWVSTNLRFAHWFFTEAYQQALDQEFGFKLRYRNHRELQNLSGRSLHE